MIPSLLVIFSAGFLLPQVSSQLATCLNYGTPLNSTDCKCPGFVSGRLCETVNCQRFSIPDKNRCVCPPGWYDKYCGIRGCRPPNEDNLDLEKRSFILVLNTKTSMREQITTLRDNFHQMIQEVTKNHTDNWIANYIVYGFVQVNQQTTVSKIITESSNEALDFVDKIELLNGDESQPVLTALKDAQQSFPQMKSHAIVLVLTDSPASDATPWSHRFSDKNMEQKCLQISLLWRSKVSFLLSLPNNTDASSDGIDVYRRLSLTNHGDAFFLQDTLDLQNILLSIVGIQYYPELLASGYGKTGDVTVSFPAYMESNTIFYLVSVDSPRGISVPSISGLNLISEGPSFKLYTLPANKNGAASSVTIISQTSSRYNYRIFIQSKKTIMFDYNDDMHIDVGNGMAVIGIPMSSTMQTYGFSDWTNSTYEVRSANGTLIREAFDSYLRPQLACTFQYGFPSWDTMNCPPGPITQVHKFYHKGELRHQRVTAGYCIESDHNEQYPEGVRSDFNIGGGISHSEKLRVQRNELECDDRNIEAVSDPRLGGHNQWIFILEQHSGNVNVYKTLSEEIREIVELQANTTSTDGYEKEFSLIVHNDIESRVVLSSYDPISFSEKFKSIVNSITLHDDLDQTMGLLSIVQAQKVNIRPTAQVFYFTNQAVINLRNVSRRWDIIERNIEVNVLTIADKNSQSSFTQLPSQLELVRKMTNGRIVPLLGNETKISIFGLFADMMAANVLTTDEVQQDCHSSPITINGYVEKDAESVVVQILGTGLRYIRIMDAFGNVVPSANFVSYQNPNYVSLNIDNSLYSRGVWKITALTTNGGCQISVRQRNRVGVMIGFTSLKSDDNDVSTQIITQRIEKAQPIYAPIRVNSEAVPTSLEIEIVDTDGSTKSYYNSSVYQRDSSTCSYNFISEDLVVPKTALTSWVVSSFDDSGDLVFRRVFYYYQHLPADTTVCQGNEVDEFGRCICPQGFTGDYCWDRICQPAATYSYGICSCPPGYYGDFCEIELVFNQTTTSEYPSHVVATSPAVETLTKRASSQNFNFFMGACLFSVGLLVHNCT